MTSRCKFFMIPGFIVIIFFCLTFSPYLEKISCSEETNSKISLYQDGGVLVIFRKGVTETMARNRICSVHGLSLKKRLRSLSRLMEKEYLLVRQKGKNASEMANMLKKDDLVEDVFLNYSGQFSSCEGIIPNDILFDSQWALCNPDDTDIDATEAWDHQTGYEDVVIAVLDTGVDYTHPDLINNMWINEAEANGTDGVDDDGNGYIDDIYGWDTGDEDSNPIDHTGHGTQVAGVIAAVGNNSEGIAGVYWNTKIMAIKVATADGDFFVSNILEAIEYIITMKELGVPIVAVNASWGFEGRHIDILKYAIEALGKQGILFVAAAGNENSNNDMVPHSPASFDLPNIISVAATNRNDNKISSSNYGFTSVDLGAPGDGILSTTSSLRYTPGTGNDIFFDDMESGNGNWIADGDWAITEEKSKSLSHSWSDSPGGNYSDGISFSLTSIPIDLSGASTPLSLGFYIQYDLEDSKDHLNIKAKIRKPSLWEITTEKGYQSTHAWSDSPYGNYPDEAYSQLEGPILDLSTADDGAELTFLLTGESEPWLDNLMVFFSPNGGETWYHQTLPSIFLGINGDYSGEWHSFSFPIVPDYRTSQFQFLFVLWTNNNNNFDGFYLDDIEVKDSSTVFFYDGMESGEYANWTRPPNIIWDLLDSYSGSSGPQWKSIIIPLNEDCFWDQFQIEFGLNTNSSINYDGVYLDNIGIGIPESNPSYSNFNGTSAAAPHVTGAIALLKAEYHEGPYSIQQRILTGVDQISSLDGLVATGGRLNLCNSIIQPPLSFQEQIERLLNFFDESVANGELEGEADKESKEKKNLENLRDLIVKAGKLIEKENYESACNHLSTAYGFSNGGDIPIVWIKGKAAPYLSFMIMDLMMNMGCNSDGTLSSAEIDSIIASYNTPYNNYQSVVLDSFSSQNVLSWLDPEISLSISDPVFISNSELAGFMVSTLTSGTVQQTPLQTPSIVPPWTKTENNGPPWYQSGPVWFKNDFGSPWWWKAPLGNPFAGPAWYQNEIKGPTWYQNPIKGPWWGSMLP